ncbi:hypothetical protein [Alteromonas oceanisediminis]|uniref:hypothetical protein n=1 Tax=Alteromonas oceanisediminis TaxID=2836180 RepID=UPI001BD9444A|nr:hypothetical protein [Alteromonas oceanisediminis]MBT0586972.1 hypothetical protein [Alteromonas oceanisediminis]
MRLQIGALLGAALMLQGCAGHATFTGNTDTVEAKHAKAQIESLTTIPPTLLAAVSNRVPSETEIFQLTPAQQAHFLAFYHSPTVANLPDNKRLFRYIDNIFTNFSYLGQTYDASTALTLESGNCISLAILTSALARLVNVDVAYQRVNVAPVYRRFVNVMTLSTHVRTHLYETIEPAHNELVVIRPRLIVDYYPQSSNIRGDMISEAAFLSMYYRNLASDAIIQRDYAYAYIIMQKALSILPSDQENLNTMAVILNKLGETQQALALYAYAANQNDVSLNLIANYTDLLTKTGQKARADQFSERLLRAHSDNPYQWIDAAEERIASGEHFIARSMLQKAIDRAPYLHEAYFSLAKSYYLTQELSKADDALTTAAQLSQLPETEKLYTAKRAVLALVEEP